jgi:hypothetical protein
MKSHPVTPIRFYLKRWKTELRNWQICACLTLWFQPALHLELRIAAGGAAKRQHCRGLHNVLYLFGVLGLGNIMNMWNRKRRSFVIQPRLHAPSHKVASLFAVLTLCRQRLKAKQRIIWSCLVMHPCIPTASRLLCPPNTRSTLSHLLAPGCVYREQVSLRREVAVELSISTFGTERCWVYKSFCRSNFLRGY